MADEYINKVEVGAKIQMMYIRREMDYGGENDFCRGMRKALRVIENMPTADVQPIIYAHKTINVGRRSYCSNCGKLAIMEDFCSKCGAKVKDSELTRNLTDEETEIYESWIDHEAKDTGVNIMDGEQNE